MEQLIFRYFNIHNFDIPKRRSFYIRSLDNSYPTLCHTVSKVFRVVSTSTETLLGDRYGCKHSWQDLEHLLSWWRQP